MKNLKHIITIFAIIIASNANATVRTLNNNNPSPGQYTNFGSAQAASSQGDTIYVSGSPISYGDISVTQYNLAIIGTGYNPQKQNPLISEFGYIVGTVGQMRIEGVKCIRISLVPLLGVAQLYVNNSYVEYSIHATTNNFDIYLYLQNNVINGTNFGYGTCIESGIIGTGDLKGIISNNILRGSIWAEANAVAGFINELNIKNNLFIKSSYSGNSLFFYNNSFSNGTISNNIILGYLSANLSSGGFMISQNNLSYPTNLTFLPNSTGMIVADPLLVNFPCPSWNCAFSNGYDYHLTTSSPGHNAGTDGTDIGPYGGPYGAHFTTYGEPPIPQMRQMNMPTQVVSGSSFSVNIISTTKAP